MYTHVRVSDLAPVDPSDGLLGNTVSFCEEVFKAFKGEIKLGIRNTNHNLVYLYRDGDVFAPVAIKYVVNWSHDNERFNKRYLVYARGIIDKRVKSSSSPDRHSRMLRSVDKAIKVIKDNFLPYSHEECAGAMLTFFKNTVSSQVAARNQEVRSKLYNLTERLVPELKSELFHLVQSGHTFISNDLRNAVVNLMEKEKERAEFPDANASLFIRLREKDGEQIADVSETNIASSDKSISPAVTIKLTELPEGVTNKLVALSIMPVGGYIENIGQRAMEDCFWIVK